jgi:hypothetical protein
MTKNVKQIPETRGQRFFQTYFQLGQHMRNHPYGRDLPAANGFRDLQGADGPRSIGQGIAFGNVVSAGVSGSSCRAVSSTTRHHGSTSFACAGSTGPPNLGIASRAPCTFPPSDLISE